MLVWPLTAVIVMLLVLAAYQQVIIRRLTSEPVEQAPPPPKQTTPHEVTNLVLEAVETHLNERGDQWERIKGGVQHPNGIKLLMAGTHIEIVVDDVQSQLSPEWSERMMNAIYFRNSRKILSALEA